MTLAQTVVLTLTMVIFILQFRSQNIATKDAAYQKALDDYTASIQMLVEKPELSSMLDDMGKIMAPEGSQAQTLSSKGGPVFGYMLLTYSLFEGLPALRQELDRRGHLGAVARLVEIHGKAPNVPGSSQEVAGHLRQVVHESGQPGAEVRRMSSIGRVPPLPSLGFR